MVMKDRSPAQTGPSTSQFRADAGFLAGIFINSPIGIYVVQHGKFRFVNLELQKNTAYSEEELLGMNSLRLVLPEDRKIVRDNAIKMLKLKCKDPYEYRAINKDGNIKWALETVTSIQYEGRRAVLGYFLDITERKKAEAALEKAYDELQLEMEERKRLEKTLMQETKLKTLGAIAAEVAHEIRNPLVSIGGFARRLKKKFPGLPECDVILKESERLEKILSRIRNYLEPVEFYPKECSVNTILNNSLKLLFPEMEAKHVACRLNLAPCLAPAYVDPDILRQIFINLILNTAEEMEHGGKLFIRSFDSVQEIHIEFKLLAAGLKVKDPESLFMPFSEGGQSFGLPLCYRLIKDMGGLLSFTQDKDCIVFKVTLPKTAGQRSEKKR